MKYNVDQEASTIPSVEVLADDFHQLRASVDIDNGDIYLDFSTREALRDFALSLLYESEFGSGELEMYPLSHEGKLHVVEGVRLTEDSSRIFTKYANTENT
ncbi:TPA: hypothetical protein NJ528_004511 [Vibrio parahaemolyticus]|uniref:hypothetical protein n=1 Tax=Vibrio parahaemolyticus TaxID=670 RepID=UPI003297EF8E|nr:hypothetical protein [Vibrio parahaemolyticus]HCE4653424.1 hypothetical protein [Vibrio parahaemolyticus]HCG8290539.1 hypothetical protein [Vibrio parahaemolyticus]HCG8295711.1 hypothetical protein [Vibrio parahaemolyticus]HCG8300934.1 hypothetical protein [Vibrio parahaemolyticus]